MDETQKTNDCPAAAAEAVPIQVDFASVAPRCLWYIVKGVKWPAKVFTAFTVATILLHRLFRQPFWLVLYSDSKFCPRPIDPADIRAIDLRQSDSIGQQLSDAGFHHLTDYTTTASQGRTIQRLYVNPGLRTYANVFVARSSVEHQRTEFTLSTLCEGHREVATLGAMTMGFPARPNAFVHEHYGLSPHEVFEKHLSYLQEQEVADWKPLSNPGLEEYFGFQAEAFPAYTDFLVSRGLARRRPARASRGASAPPVTIKYCYRHHGEPATAVCSVCGNSVCPECLRHADRANYCTDCLASAPPPVRPQLDPAGYVRRTAAMVLDWWLLLSGTALLVLGLGSLARSLPVSDLRVSAVMWLMLLAFLLYVPAYFIYLTGRTGMTLGKRALRIKVVASDGRTVSYWDAAVRHIGYLLSLLPVGIGYLVPLWDKDKRALHDRFAETRVVRAKGGRAWPVYLLLVLFTGGVTWMGLSAWNTRIRCERKWTVSLPSTDRSAAYPVIAGDLVVLGLGRSIEARTLETGKRAWSYAFARGSAGNSVRLYTLGPPLVADGVVYAGVSTEPGRSVGASPRASGQGMLTIICALDAKTGRAIWRREMTMLARSEMRFTNPNTLLVAGYLPSTDRFGHTLRAAMIERRSGEVSSKDYPVDAPVNDALFFQDRLCYSADQYLTCIDPTTGRMLWDFGLGSGRPIRSSNGTIITGNYCLDSRTGAVLWHVPSNFRISGSDGELFSHGWSEDNGYISLLEERSGKSRWRTRVSGMRSYGTRLWTDGPLVYALESHDSEMGHLASVSLSAISRGDGRVLGHASLAMHNGIAGATGDSDHLIVVDTRGNITCHQFIVPSVRGARR